MGPGNFRAGGHGPYVKFAQEGSVIAGYVARDMVDGDCRQAREPSKDGTGALKFFRKSGAPQFEFIIALNVQASAEYPDGKATLATSKYRLHSAVVRAMQEQQYQAGEGLREGDLLEVQRIGDVNSGMGQPALSRLCGEGYQAGGSRWPGSCSAGVSGPGSG